MGFTITKFWLRFYQHKSNLKIYCKGRRDFKQKKLLGHFYSKHCTGPHENITIQIIDHFDPKDQDRREDFWIFKLKSLYPY